MHISLNTWSCIFVTSNLFWKKLPTAYLILKYYKTNLIHLFGCVQCALFSHVITCGDSNSRNRIESWIWFQFQKNGVPGKSKLKLRNLFSCNQNLNNLIWIQLNLNCFDWNQNSNLFFIPQPLPYFTSAKYTENIY